MVRYLFSTIYLSTYSSHYDQDGYLVTLNDDIQQYTQYKEKLTFIVVTVFVGQCPVYNTVAKKMDSRVCFGTPKKEVYISDAVYKCIPEY